MNKTGCIICKAPATRTAEVVVCLEHWQGESRNTGAEIGLCAEHASCVMPILILNNPRVEEICDNTKTEEYKKQVNDESK